jgi:hypothetical protein
VKIVSFLTQTLEKKTITPVVKLVHFQPNTWKKKARKRGETKVQPLLENS